MDFAILQPAHHLLVDIYPNHVQAMGSKCAGGWQANVAQAQDT
jgi:hypothetical protein